MALRFLRSFRPAAFVLAASISGATLPGSAFAAASFDELTSVLRDERVSESDAALAALYASGRRPTNDVTWTSTVLSIGDGSLQDRAHRTIADQDVDWYPSLKKRVHPNGICLSGEWRIDAASPYTGLFRQGTRALFVGRASAAMGATTQGHPRGFGIGGKVLPTLDPSVSVATANFFGVDVLFGTERSSYLGARLTNEPKPYGRITDLLSRPGDAALGAAIAHQFEQADSNPGIRQLYPLSESGLGTGETARAPKWMAIEADAPDARDQRADFRDEIAAALERRGRLTFAIWASDDSKDADEIGGPRWIRLGSIELNKAYVSFGCDGQLHIPHPRWRD